MTKRSATLPASCIVTYVAYVACVTCVLVACDSSDKDTDKDTAHDHGQAGAGATDEVDAAGSGSDKTKVEPVDIYADQRGSCKIKSGYDDDKACIAAPKPSEGMQIHVGPSDYNDKDEVAKYLLHPGEESSECWTFHTPNDETVYYQTFALSGRAGTHHIINTMFNDQAELQDGGFTTCADPGIGTNVNIIDNLPGASKPYMARGTVAPENAHVGRKIEPHTAAQADMHYYNFTDHDIIREFWMNIYFVKKEDVTEEAQQIRGMGGFGWSSKPIAPGTDQVFKYSCPIKGNGRILSLLGHYHAHGRQFTASIKRKNGDIEKVFDMYDYMDPATFEYNTAIENPTFSDGNAGATSGILEVEDGDTLLWDCHIVNDSNVGLKYVNQLKTGEMCNLWGSSLGIDTFNCLLP
jgi:hypothetical protein